jgi:4'-phosphopantetheinyl transferase
MPVGDMHWMAAGQPSPLKMHDVHVWHASLDQPSAVIERVHQWLSADERQRAARFRLERHRNRFVVGRGLLRNLLGCYLNVDPGDVRLAYRAHGKPYLADPKLHFNLAHSQALVLYAFTSQLEVGVDVEHIAPLPEADQIAARFFSPEECATLNTLPQEQKAEGFFTCWTRKEAYIKALTTGLSESLGQIHVWPFARLPQWLIKTFSPSDAYIASLAIADLNASLSFFRFAS